jgi:GMP synthase-like glutamine amidotransferase
LGRVPAPALPRPRVPRLLRRRRPTLLAFQQDDAHGPGRLARWAAERRVRLHVVRLDRAEPLPPARAGDPAVLLGTSRLPSALGRHGGAHLLAWLAGALEHDRPVLSTGSAGVLHGMLLGGTLEPQAEPELGWTTIVSDDAALADGPWLSWRRDAVRMPPSVRVTGFNAHGAQAFQAGRHTGVVFHPQVTTRMLARWCAAVEDLDHVASDARRHDAGARAAAFALFDGWAATAGLRPAPAEAPAAAAATAPAIPDAPRQPAIRR